jgi:hypothetical protein
MRDSPRFLDLCERLLSRGQAVRFRAEGWSMYPAIQDGDIVDVEPVSPPDIRLGDVLLCRIGTTIVAHRAVSIEGTPAERIVLRGDAAFADDDPIAASEILGLVTATTRAESRRRLNSRTARVAGRVGARLWRAKRSLSERLRAAPRN